MSRSSSSPTALFVLILVVTPLGFGGVPSTTPIDPDTFQRLSKAERLDVMLAGLREHNGRLENSHLKFSAARTGVGPGTSLKSDCRSDLYFVGDRYRCELENTLVKTNGTKTEERSRYSWDGKNFTIWAYSTGNPRASASIDDKKGDESGLEVVWGFTDQLGIRREDHAMSVAEWLHFLITNRTYFDWGVDTAEFDGSSCIKVFLSSVQAKQRHEYIIDTAHDFIIRQHTYAVPDEKGVFSDFITAQTTQVRKLDSTWVPERVTRTVVTQTGARGNRPAGTYTMTTAYELTVCEPGGVVESDLAVALSDPSTTTRVTNSSKLEAYELGRDGVRRDLPIFNPLTNRVVGPATSSVGPTTRFGPRD
jgi:hypothetical protein